MRRRLTVTECEPQDVSKQPLRRLEVPLNRFTKVAIPLHLEILEKHKANIHRFAELRQWDRVHREQVNAARTVQQLKSDILEIDLVRCQVRDEDVVEFDRRLEPIKTRAIEAVVELISLQHGDRGYEIPRLSDSALCEESEAENESAASERLQLLEAVEISLEEKRQVLQSWENLKQDLDDLNSMMAELSAAVRQQGEAVDRIEDHVSVADANVEEGTRILAAAAKMKMMLLPVAGAVVGGVIAGPIGLLTGFKIAGLAAALSGSVFGYQGGKYIKQKHKVGIEMAEIRTRCSSMPHLHEGALPAAAAPPKTPPGGDMRDAPMSL